GGPVSPAVSSTAPAPTSSPPCSARSCCFGFCLSCRAVANVAPRVMTAPTPVPAPANDDAFLRGLVKSSRQRTVHLRWTDRDGTARITTLTAAEATRLNALARARGLSAEALLRDIAHQKKIKGEV